jgi:hypothetical protein
MSTLGSIGIWNGWRDIAPQNSAVACTNHLAPKGPDNAGEFMLIQKASSAVWLHRNR